MRVLVRDDQSEWNRALRVRAELGSLHLSDQIARRRLDFPREFRCEKNRRFRNAKIRRPDFGLIHRPDERGVLFRSELRVKAGALDWFHRPAP